MLVNGDFQINQRGQVAYIGELVRCFDMWLLVKGFITNNAYETTPKPENGILMVYNTNYENNQLWQFLDEELDYDKYYTLSYSVNGVHYSFTFKPTQTGYHENVHDKFRVYTTLESSRQKRAICIELFKGKTINLEYIELFEGTVAYQHQKEDYAIALLKCQQKLKVVTSSKYQTLPSVFKYYNSSLIGSVNSSLCQPATVVVKGKYTLFSTSGGKANVPNISIEFAEFDHTNGLFTLRLTKSYGLTNGDSCLVQPDTDDGSIVITSEPS